MAENHNAVPLETGRELDHNGDVKSVAASVPPGQTHKFCPAEIPVRVSLLPGESALMRTFFSRGFIQSPISVTCNLY